MYIVIETFPVDHPSIVNDYEGNPLLFDDITDANKIGRASCRERV